MYVAPKPPNMGLKNAVAEWVKVDGATTKALQFLATYAIVGLDVGLLA